SFFPFRLDRLLGRVPFLRSARSVETGLRTSRVYICLLFQRDRLQRTGPVRQGIRLPPGDPRANGVGDAHGAEGRRMGFVAKPGEQTRVGLLALDRIDDRGGRVDEVIDLLAVVHAVPPLRVSVGRSEVGRGILTALVVAPVDLTVHLARGGSVAEGGLV